MSTSDHDESTERRRPYEAVVSDMDGVLTRTATLHERAWTRVFDAFLSGREGQRPFSDGDYRAHVDGKPRYDGVADFLSSRHIDLPWGEPSDGPDAETVYGLGNRKNGVFLALLDREGVKVFDDAVAAFERWRRGGLKVAVVSSSRNCRRVLRAAGLERHLDAVVDGELGAELGLGGKREIMLEAARRLGVAPSDAVVLEDATAGVRAGRLGGFGRVVGVSRDDNERDLREAGADDVVRSVYRVRFLRRVPRVLDRLAELAAWRGDRALAVFLDYDGTLAPIVDDPRDATMSDAMRAALTKLTDRCPVAVVSGRDRQDVAQRVGIDGLAYAGNHGFDIAGPGYSRTLPEAEQALGDVDRAEEELRRHLGRLSGVIIERKRFSVAVHYRQVASASAVDQIDGAVESVHRETSLRRRWGKKVFELEPAVDWDKGRALLWLMDALPRVDRERTFVVYAGDDETDEDAFAAIEGRGAGVRVGSELTRSLADYRLEGPAEVQELLDELARSTR